MFFSLDFKPTGGWVILLCPFASFDVFLNLCSQIRFHNTYFLCAYTMILIHLFLSLFASCVGARNLRSNESPHPPLVFSELEEIDLESELSPHDRALLVSPPQPVENGLIVRIIGVDGSGNPVNPVLSEDEAYRRAFAPTNSAAAQFYDCSGGDFTFVPFQHASLYRSGIITVTVDDIPYSTHTKNSLRLAADAKVCEAFGLGVGCNVGAHHKMFIMPAGLSDGHDYGFLSAAVGGDYSIFGDSPRYNLASFDTEGILHEVARKCPTQIPCFLYLPMTLSPHPSTCSR